MRRTSVITFIIALTVAMAIQAAVPQLINYRARLVNASGVPVADGANFLRFVIYDSATGGTELWNSGIQQVQTNSGLFTYQLGSNTPLPTGVFDGNPSLYLGITVGADPEIAPRTQFISVGYAHVADRASVASRADSSNHADNATTAINATNATNAATATSATRAGFADSTEAITDGAVDFADVGQNGATAGQLMKWSGSAWVAADDAGLGVTASGWVDNGTVVRLETSTDSVGIGTTTPAAELEVKGDFLLSGKATIGPGLTNPGTNAIVAGDNNDARGIYSVVAEGGSLDLLDGLGAMAIRLSGGSTDDASVILKDNAINADEILNEPGIAISSNNGVGVLTAIDTAQDLATVSITIPTDGYIVVEGNAYTFLAGAGACFGWLQIDETAGGNNFQVSFRWTNANAYAHTTSSYIYDNTTVRRVYFKGAGTYTFRLEGNAFIGNSTSALVRNSGNWLQATYYPSSYGIVATIAPTPGDSPNPKTVGSIDPMTNTESTLYEIDLRYLELAAKSARVKAQAAEIALLNAKLEASAELHMEGAPSTGKQK